MLAPSLPTPLPLPSFPLSEEQSTGRMSDQYAFVFKADPDPAHQGGRTRLLPEDAIHALH